MATEDPPPLRSRLSELPPSELLDVVEGADRVVVDEALAAWRARREPGAAADELATALDDLADDGLPGRQRAALLVTAFDGLGDGGEVRARLDRLSGHPVAGGAVTWSQLVHGDREPADVVAGPPNRLAETMAAALLRAAAGLPATGSPVPAAAADGRRTGVAAVSAPVLELLAHAGDATAQAQVVAALATVSTPAATAVLTAIAETHPSRRVARTARRGAREGHRPAGAD